MGAMTEDSGKKFCLSTINPGVDPQGGELALPLFSRSIWLLGYSAFSLNPHPSFSLFLFIPVLFPASSALNPSYCCSLLAVKKAEDSHN